MSEFCDVIRHHLKVSIFDLPDEGLRKLVDAVDADRSGFVEVEELHDLLMRGDAYVDTTLRSAGEAGEGDLPDLAVRLQLDRTWKGPQPAKDLVAVARPPTEPRKRRLRWTRPFDRSNRPAPRVKVVSPRLAEQNRTDYNTIPFLPEPEPAAELSLFPAILLEIGKRGRRKAGFDGVSL